MFTPKSPAACGFRKRYGRPKQSQEACNEHRIVYSSWFDLLLKRELILVEEACIGERYCCLRGQVLSLQGFKPYYQCSHAFVSKSAGRAPKELSVLQQKRLLKRWQFFEDKLPAADRAVLDYCTVEPLNYRLSDWQLKELGGRVRRALALISH